MVVALVFLFGLMVGSFLNVCIHRLPLGQSIVSPRSRCPLCETPIPAHHNIPLLSYLFLRGRCGACGRTISARYPLVELLTGMMFVAVLHFTGLRPELVIYCAFTAALIVVTFIDLDYQIIPDPISLPGIPIGIAAAALGYGPTLRDSLLGAFLGGGMLLAVAAGYEWLTDREGMGGGDIKLMAMIGAFLGWRGVLVTLLVGSFSGSLIGLLVMIVRGTNTQVPIPFGPFLSLGALVALFYGTPLLDWYTGLALGR